MGYLQVTSAARGWCGWVSARRHAALIGLGGTIDKSPADSAALRADCFAVLEQRRYNQASRTLNGRGRAPAMSKGQAQFVSDFPTLASDWTRALFEAIDDAVFVHDADGNILD